jgi:hypothetical protein
VSACDQGGARCRHHSLNEHSIQGDVATQGKRCDSHTEQKQTTDSSMPVAITWDEVSQAESERPGKKQGFKPFRNPDQSSESGDSENQRPRDTMHEAGRRQDDCGSIAGINFAGPVAKHVLIDRIARIQWLSQRLLMAGLLIALAGRVAA